MKRPSPWLILTVTTLGTLLASIQGSALILALPEVMHGLNADFLTLLWVLLGYLLTSTALVPLIGRLSDLWGRTRFYLAGFALFTLASVAGGTASPAFHGWDLVGWRLLQGIGGALLMANSTALVTDAFGRERVGTAMGISQIALAAGFVLGPLVGGVLAAWDWRLVFWLNGPLGVVGFLWAWFVLPRDHEEPEEGHFDVRGTVAFLVGMVGVLLALSLLAMPGVGAVTIAVCGGVGVVSLALFARWEARARHPFLHLALFTDPRLGLPNAAAALNALARGAVLFLLTFYLQGPYGLTPFWAGVATAPFGLAFMLAGPAAGWLADRGKPAVLSTGGLLLSALGLLGLGFLHPHENYFALATLMVLIGAGSGFFNTPNITQVMGRVDPHQRGITSATRVLLVNAGQMVSLAVVFPFVLSRLPEAEMVQIFLYGGGLGGASLEAPLMDGLHEAFLVSFVLTVIAAVLSALGYRVKAGETKVG